MYRNVNPSDLSANDIITYDLLSVLQAACATNPNSDTMNIFLDTTFVSSFLNTLQTAARKKWTKFIRDPSQKVTQWIIAIERVGAFPK